MFLGIDLGTSGVKAVLADESGKVLNQSGSPLKVSRPQPLWSEQAPEDWWRAVSNAVLGLDASLRRHVRAIGLAGQMHGATLLDNDDKPLRPAILWNDGRSHAECQEIEATELQTRAITGNVAMPGFTAPKLAWVKKYEPDLFAATRMILLPKDYVRLQMTGDKASDMSDSAGTLWLDVAARDWSDAMLEATKLSRDHMPTLFEGCQPTGILRSGVAEQWGMDTVPVVAGGGDNAAGAAGIGVIDDGDAFLSLGTSGVIFVATGDFRPNPERAMHAFCHCLPDTWHQMSVHLSAASCVDWAVQQLGLNYPSAFFKLSQNAQPGDGPEIFLPYLSGERTPHNDPHIRASWLRCDNDTNPARLACSVLEGVAFSFADGLDALREAGTQIKSLSVIGGGARSRYWGQIIAATLNVRLQYLDGGEVGPALGAAKLAMMAATGISATEACTRPAIVDTIEPDPVLAERLVPKLETFRRAYTAISNL